MSQLSSEEKFRQIVQGDARPLAAIKQTIAENLWSEAIGLGRPLTEREVQALTDANFVYDEKSQVAHKQRADGRGRE